MFLCLFCIYIYYMTNFLHEIVSKRQKKPRETGLTHAVDHMEMPPESYGPNTFEFVDVVKIGWGLPALLDIEDLKQKIAAYHRFEVKVSSGGTLTEYAMMKKHFEKYLNELSAAKFDVVEISESRLNLSLSEKKKAILSAKSRNLDVAVKIGRKNPKEQLSSFELKKKLDEAAALDAWKIVIEAGEGFGVALFGEDGQLKSETLDLICSTINPERVIFEAPLRHQRGALIFRLGADANIGGISLGEVPALETQRLGIMSGETFGLVKRSKNILGGPAAKFVYFLISTRSPIGQEELIRMSNLPRRTVQSALEKLRGADLIIEEPEPSDLRRKVYRPVP